MLTVTRLRPATSTIDAYGDAEVTSYDELEIEGVGFAPEQLGEENATGRQGVPHGAALYCPHGVDVAATDLMRLPDGSMWRVDGDPADWSHMFTGWDAGTVVPIARYEG